MKKLLSVTAFLAALVLAFTAGAWAARPSSNPASDNAKVSIPDTAREISPGVYHLGSVLYQGRQADGYAIVDYRRSPAKPTGCKDDGVCQGWEDASCADCGGGGGGGGETDTSSCYSFLANGARWKEVEPWVVNPANTRGLSSTSVFDSLDGGVETWEDASDGSVDGAKGHDILGSGSTTSETLVADLDNPDDKNEVYFADVDSPGAIAVTIVWGYFYGNPAWRELIEWDQVYDDVDFDWSEDCTVNDCTSEGSKKMDYPNIAIHELGHSVGLDDLYDEKCAEVTMYGYGDYGETKKRTLEDGDINGVSKLYK